MRFWDSSAVVPLIFREPTSESLDELLADDGGMAVWWGTWAECAVTVSRLKRDGKLDEEFERETHSALDRLASDWMEVEPFDDLRLLAAILSKDHPLKTADSFQLAAASAGARAIRMEPRSYASTGRCAGPHPTKASMFCRRLSEGEAGDGAKIHKLWSSGRWTMRRKSESGLRGWSARGR